MRLKNTITYITDINTLHDSHHCPSDEPKHKLFKELFKCFIHLFSVR